MKPSKRKESAAFMRLRGWVRKVVDPGWLQRLGMKWRWEEAGAGCWPSQDKRSHRRWRRWLWLAEALQVNREPKRVVGWIGRGRCRLESLALGIGCLYSRNNAAESSSPNDLKLSDCGGRRGGCSGRRRRGAAAVTPGAVRCSAWLDVAAIARAALEVAEEFPSRCMREMATTTENPSVKTSVDYDRRRTNGDSESRQTR